tara:strand:+ start:11184 stop:11339 length:156 start_codon:yes stop_codon:yes gene_type:complete
MEKITKEILIKAYNAGFERCSFENTQHSKTEKWVSSEPPTFERWYRKLVKE